MAATKKVIVNPKYTHLKDYLENLPDHWDNNEGKVIYKGRNELREMEVKGVTMVVKSFQKPNWINQIAYGLIRSSKAQRSFEYALMLLDNGIGTPEPLAYCTERKGLFFDRSFYACLKSECPYTYMDLMKEKDLNHERILRAIAQLTARIHDLGWIHKDYSRGNILFKETPEEVKLEIIDLNRIRFHHIGIKEGCKNFERLPATPQMNRWIADEYARIRKFDAEECFRLIQAYQRKRAECL